VMSLRMICFVCVYGTELILIFVSENEGWDLICFSKSSDEVTKLEMG